MSKFIDSFLSGISDSKAVAVFMQAIAKTILQRSVGNLSYNLWSNHFSRYSCIVLKNVVYKCPWMCSNSCGFCNHWQVDSMNWAVTEWDSCFSKSKWEWECCIAFGNTWDDFINFLCEFQSVFWRRSWAIKNSDYQWYFYVVKCNFNEKRVNGISIGNIKLCQDFVMRNLVNKEPYSSANSTLFLTKWNCQN